LVKIERNCLTVLTKCNFLFYQIIAATGGLLGLGFGFSILSAAEVLYFVFVRWIYYRYQKKKRQTIARVFPLHTLALLATNNKSSNYQFKSPFPVVLT